MHSATNQVVGHRAVHGARGRRTCGQLSGSLPGWLTAALLWIGAAYFLVDMPLASSLGPVGGRGRV